VRPALQRYPERAREEVERSVRRADLVKASEEDVRYLYPDSKLEFAVACWLALGPELVVITRGERGPVAYTMTGSIERPSPRVEVVDTVGAGPPRPARSADGRPRSDPGRGRAGRRDHLHPCRCRPAVARRAAVPRLSAGRAGRGLS
jgi:fructokinase